MISFKQFWKIQNGFDPFDKARDLNANELRNIQDLIKALQDRNLPSYKIITALQKANVKLSERWKAERAYWTEVKRMDTDAVFQAGEDLDIERYKVILSPNACEKCRGKTQNGKRVFKSSDVEKGEGAVPPFHPNCYCILIPMP